MVGGRKEKVFFWFGEGLVSIFNFVMFNCECFVNVFFWILNL